MRKNIYKVLLSLLIIIGVTSSVQADVEKFDLYPALGTFTSNQKFFNYIKTHQKIKIYNNKLLYSPSFRLLENKYLIIKALELGQMSNEKFLDNINNIDKSYNKIDEILKTVSIEENIKKIFASSAILGFTTDIIGKELNTVGFATHALKQVLETEYVKLLLIKEFSYITKSNYEVYTTMILSSIEISLEFFSQSEVDKLLWKAVPKHMWIDTFSKSFSKLVGIPLAIYETGLKSINIGATLGAMFELNKAKNMAMPNRLASSFLYDYINIFKGDIEKMSSYIKNNYKYFNPPSKNIYSYIQGDIKIYQKKSKIGYPIKINSFFDVFYWYTVVSNYNSNNILDLFTYKYEDLANIARGARKALDYIENYGNGGNFKFSAEYNIKVTLRKNISKALATKLDDSWNQLYYMHKNFNNDSRKIHYKFYKYDYIPNIKISKGGEKKVVLNSTTVYKYQDIKIISDIEKNSTAFISNKLSPEVTITFNGEKQVKKFQTFYLDYGFYTGMSISNIGYGQKVFANAYNQGYLNTLSESFKPKNPAYAELFIDLLYGYVDGFNSRNLWNKCKKESTCKDNIHYKLDYIKRDTLAKVIVNKYNLSKYLKNYGTLRPFKRKGKDWTKEGKVLYKLKIMSGDSSTEKMNGSSYVSKIELLVIMKRLKNLIIAKGKK